MDGKLVSAAADPRSHEQLEPLYTAGYIAAEKKPFLIDLQRGSGPFLAIADSDRYLLDAASQIATYGLAFNHPSLFGAAQHLESWLDRSETPWFAAVQRSFSDLLRRKLVEQQRTETSSRGPTPAAPVGADEFTATFCHSGAQAIELAFAVALNRPRPTAAHRILAFESAFHGRTKIALETTYGPDKRLPFSWTEHAACFVPYPELPGDQIEFPYDRAPWKQLWCESDDQQFKERLNQFLADQTIDPLARSEIHSLQAVRERLRSGEFFCILVEPLQSEGGDRYSSARFHQGLAWLAQTHAIPLIYDEIQCGIHLGRTFFWHRQFELVGVDDRPWIPDLVVCAKKTQLGIVLSRWPLEYRTPPPVASLYRGYIQSSLLDQSGGEIEGIEREVRSRLTALTACWPGLVSRPRGRGLAFAFDLPDATWAKQFVEQRFSQGLLFYPAGQRTARFRLSLAFGAGEIELLFAQLDSALAALRAPASGVRIAPAEVAVTVRDPAPLYAFHARWIETKLARLGDAGNARSSDDVGEFLRAEFARLHPPITDAEICVLDRASYRDVRAKIVAIQSEVYEPARQTPGSDFDAVFDSALPLGIVVLQRGRLIGMAIAGSIDRFHHVEGIPEDPLAHDPETVYMVAVTVVTEFRGGLGRLLKQALTLLATQRGVRWMVGRNRDRRARGMWAINLSLGAVQTQHLVDSYDDEAPDRDCLVYHLATQWTEAEVQLSTGSEAPFSRVDLTADFVRENLPAAVNKLTLSNFVDPAFLRDLRDVIELFPRELRHAYTASSLAEAVDKIAKVLHLVRSPRRCLLTIEGHTFGDGTLLTRALSSAASEFFEVVRLPPLPSSDHSAWLATLREQLQHDRYLAFWLEPLPQGTFIRLPRSLLEQIASACRAADVPLIFHETGGLFYRYGRAGFSASAASGVFPDGIVANLGGQMALSLLCQRYFDAAPLKLISTWDGDAFSLAKFAAVARTIERDRTAHFDLIDRFQARLIREAQSAGAVGWQLENGVGWIEGLPPGPLARLCREFALGRHGVCPAPGEMRRFV